LSRKTAGSRAETSILVDLSPKSKYENHCISKAWENASTYSAMHGFGGQATGSATSSLTAAAHIAAI